MTELIARITSESNAVEIAFKDHGRNELVFKKIETQEFCKIIRKSFERKAEKYVPTKNIILLNPQIIAIDEHYTVIKQEEKKRIVNYAESSSGNMLVYNINFPNAIYIVYFSHEKVGSIECYSYKEYKAEETELYEYPMPNELSGNKMCIGNAERKIIDKDIVGALERIIFTPYSHSTFSGMNGFSITKTYFEYLESNEFPYKLMKPLNKKLKDVLKG
ncbi:hypothetical protein NMU03_00810 [Allocoprobacillus halotolerans]|uniref:PRTRC system protein B n=1 Tax=Allocoprobacillus halotolerans TaxID=2944914 RepID=A0ABY5I5C3_9FIRM|nr:hypothetical protein [Allocoprobacillus halotolerans]UTY39406.1 hypothetical protein NMU03_00810 [Allocoprobacillus halotolerans]